MARIIFKYEIRALKPTHIYRALFCDASQLPH